MKSDACTPERNDPSAWPRLALPSRESMELAVLTSFVAAAAIYGLLNVSRTETYPRMNVPTQREHLPRSFYDADALTGYSYNIVPDILHLVRFNDSVWYYNAGTLPTEALLEPHPHLVHRMYYGLETTLDMLDALYEPHAYPYWRNAFAIHFLSNYRMQSPYDPLHAAPLNESNIRDYDNAFGQMARSVLFGTSDFVSPDVPVLSVAELAARKDRGEDLTSMRPGNARPFFHDVINVTA